MAPAPPTRREALLLIILLFSLVFLSNLNSPSKHLPSFSAILNTSQHVETRPSWESSSSVPETKLVVHAPGWTLFDKLYIFKGVVYIVSDHPSMIPDVKFIYSKGIEIKPGKGNETLRLPSDENIRVINSQEAEQLFRTGIQTIDGITLLVNDPKQFITHYYHWSAELWFGFWRTYSSLDPTISTKGDTTLPPLRRIVFPRLNNIQWQDYANMNQWVARSSFPSATMEFMDDWRDRAEMGKAFVFDRILVADRSAAMNSDNHERFLRTAGSAFALPGSADWWAPIRNNVIQFAGLDPDVGSGTTGTPVITYISRQEWGRRMLIPEHHEKLVQELYKLRDKYGYEVNVVSAEKLSRIEQIRLAARTTIMMGVHGNGLTSLVWMKPTPRATVIEFFFPEGFVHDYEYTTRALGMMHFGIWGSKYFTSPRFPVPKYVEGFQGNSIPVDGEVVARLCVGRITLAIQVDD